VVPVQRMRCLQARRHSRPRLLENDGGRDRSSRDASSKSPFVAQRVYIARNQMDICRDVAIRNHISKPLTASLSTYRLPNKKIQTWRQHETTADPLGSTVARWRF